MSRGKTIILHFPLLGFEKRFETFLKTRLAVAGQPPEFPDKLDLTRKAKLTLGTALGRSRVERPADEKVRGRSERVGYQPDDLCPRLSDILFIFMTMTSPTRSLPFHVDVLWRFRVSEIEATCLEVTKLVV